MLHEIEHAALSAADLTQQLLAYWGKGEFIIEPLRLNSLIQGMAALLKSAVSEVVCRLGYSTVVPLASMMRMLPILPNSFEPAMRCLAPSIVS